MSILRCCTAKVARRSCHAADAARRIYYAPGDLVCVYRSNSSRGLHRDSASVEVSSTTSEVQPPNALLHHRLRESSRVKGSSVVPCSSPTLWEASGSSCPASSAASSEKITSIRFAGQGLPAAGRPSLLEASYSSSSVIQITTSPVSAVMGPEIARKLPPSERRFVRSRTFWPGSGIRGDFFLRKRDTERKLQPPGHPTPPRLPALLRSLCSSRAD